MPDSLKSLSSQYWRNGHFYTFSQENKHNYKTFKSVENDKNLLKKFEKYIDTKDKIFLPGEKDLNLAKVKISKLDSTDSEVNKALDLLSDFYDREEKKRRKSEELLLEFAGLFNGTEGRLIQALKNDETVQTAIDILSNNSAYFSSLSSSGIIEN